MHRSSNHSRRGGRGHTHEVPAAARRHAVNIEARKPPRAATEEKEADEPPQLNQVEFGRRTRGRHRMNAPRICQQGRSHAKADYIGQRVKLFAEFAVRAHRPGHAAVERVEQDRDADGGGRIVEVSRRTLERRQNRVVPAKKIRHRENAWKDVYAAAKAVISERPFRTRFFFAPDRIYVVEFHFARMLSPPLTCWPR